MNTLAFPCIKVSLHVSLLVTLFLSMGTGALASDFDPAQPVKSGYTLTFSDEFDGKTLDTTKWKDCPEWKRQGGSVWKKGHYSLNGEGQIQLLTTKGEADGLAECAAIHTKGLFQQKFGYFEVRTRLPKINGGWTAFWMMPVGKIDNSEHHGTGIDGMEIDIYESINGWAGKVNHALHWDGYAVHHKHDSKSAKRPDLYDGKFHTFGFLWTPREYVFYIDNKETWRTTNGKGGISQVESYLKLTMEVSNKKWAGDFKKQETFPIVWEVDYVRVYSPSKAVVGQKKR